MQARMQSKWTDLAVWFGIVVCVGLIAISAVLNFRVGYRSADTRFDAWVYGIGVALIDVLKAGLPFVIGFAWAHRQWVRGAIATFVFLLFSLYSVTAGVRFAAQHQAFGVGKMSGEMEQRSALKATLQRLEETAKNLGPQRSEEEVAQAIEAVLARPVANASTVATFSERCTLARKLTRDACAEVAVLQTELARARQKADVDAQLNQATRELVALGTTGAGPDVDPQVKALQGILAWSPYAVSEQTIRQGLVLVIGVLFEVGSGLGLYLVTTPWRIETVVADEAQRKAPSENEGSGMVDGAVELGSVVAFAGARLEPVAGRKLTVTQMFEDYVAWCAREKAAPMRMADFYFAFDSLAQEVGIPVQNRGANTTYRDVGLIGNQEQPPQIAEQSPQI